MARSASGLHATDRLDQIAITKFLWLGLLGTQFAVDDFFEALAGREPI